MSSSSPHVHTQIHNRQQKTALWLTGSRSSLYITLKQVEWVGMPLLISTNKPSPVQLAWKQELERCDCYVSSRGHKSRWSPADLCCCNCCILDWQYNTGRCRSMAIPALHYSLIERRNFRILESTRHIQLFELRWHIGGDDVLPQISRRSLVFVIDGYEHIRNEARGSPR